MEENINKLLLNAYKIEEFEGRKIFFLRKNDFYELLKIKDMVIQKLIEEGTKESLAKKRALYHNIKIINPSTAPIKVIRYIYIRSYSLIKNKKKIIEEYLQKDFIIWANKERKEVKKFIKENKLNEIESKKFFDKVEEKILQTKKIIDEIMQNPDKFEIKRTNLLFQKELYKPYVFFYDFGKGKTDKSYLREDVPNVVYEDNKTPQRKPRPVKVDKELSEMKHLFGYIYYKEEKS